MKYRTISKRANLSAHLNSITQLINLPRLFTQEYLMYLTDSSGLKSCVYICNMVHIWLPNVYSKS